MKKPICPQSEPTPNLAPDFLLIVFALILALFGALNGLIAQNFKHFSIPEGLPGKNVNSLLEDEAGNIIIGTGSGVVSYDGYTCTPILPQGATSQLSDQFWVLCMMFDKSGNLWVGTLDRGLLFKAKNSSVLTTDHRVPIEYTNKSISSLTLDKAGRIWMVMLERNLLVRFDPETGETKLVELKHGDNVQKGRGCHSVTYDPTRNQVWVSFDLVYLAAFDANSIEQVAEKEIKGIDPVKLDYRQTFMHISPDDKLWISTYGSSMYQLDLKTKELVHFPSKNSKGFPGSEMLRDFFIDKDGVLARMLPCLKK